CHHALHHTPEERWQTLEYTDALRRPQRFEQFLIACEAASIGRTDLDASSCTQAAQLRQDLAAARTVDARSVLGNANAKGPEVATLIRAARIAAIAEQSGV